MRRAAVVLILALAVLVSAAAPADAHRRASDATSFDSRIVEEPDLAGVGWRTYDGGLLVEVTNAGPHELVVLGYEGEPFLRVGPDGVYENLNSPAAYLNRDRYADVAVPPRADPTASADWVRVGDGPTHVWHDHRTHWMAPQLPQVVADAPRQHHLVMDWAVPVRVGSDDHQLTGELRWDPPTPPAFWALLITALTTAGVVALRRTHSREAVLRVAAAVVGLVAALNTVHFVDEIAARPEPLLDVLFGVLHTGLFTLTGIAAGWWAWQPRDGRRLVLGVGAGAVVFHQGLLHLPVLTNTYVETVWPVGLIRTLVVASFVQFGVAAAVLWRTRDRDPDPAGHRRSNGVPEGHAERGPSVPSGQAQRPIDGAAHPPTVVGGR